MNHLKPIQYHGERVLTTAQLAEAYGADNKQINDNFQYNENRYTVGKHFFVLQGEELKQFKATTEISGNLKYAPVIYLWTKKGAWLHAKSLNTDEAWEAYEMLVDDYYEKIDAMNQMIQPTQMEILATITQRMAQQEREEMERKLREMERDHEVKALQAGFTALTENLTAVPDAAKVVHLINEYSRWTRMGHNEIYNRIYDIMKDQHGISVQERVHREREKINAERIQKTGRPYAESTLKKMVNGIDVMVRMGVLDKFHTILVGMLAKAKRERILN